MSLASVPQQVAEFYGYRREAMRQLTSVCTAFAEGPRDGVDYQSLAATMPKIRARIEYIDQSLFQLATLVFSTLISDKEDSQGHTSNLSITCSQRNDLVEEIDTSFSASDLQQKNPPWGVAQAQLFDQKLKEFGCSPG